MILDNRLDTWLSEKKYTCSNCQIGFCKNSCNSVHMFEVKYVIDYYFSKGFILVSLTSKKPLTLFYILPF